VTDFPVGETDTPIFWSLYWKYQFSGRGFPVKITVNKPAYIPFTWYHSGIEPLHSGYYKRKVRVSEDDPLYEFLKELV